MARDWANQGRPKLGCSYKRTTLVICSINIVVALYVLHSFYDYLHLYSTHDAHHAAKYTPDQIRKMKESVQIRRAAEPVQLVKLVEKLNKHLHSGELDELPKGLKQKISDEISQTLKGLNGNSNQTLLREAVESWRIGKLQEVKDLINGNTTINSTFLPEEAALLIKALSSNWEALSENIGLWIPTEVIHTEQNDNPGDEEETEEEVLPGRPLPQECNGELHTDYDGAAVRWGLTHHKESAADCCQACLNQAKHAIPGRMKCNIWVYCPSEAGCYSPDIYEHKQQECWLKFAEQPKLNFKDKYSEEYRNAHPTAPLIVPWVSGIVRV
ncbi:hypothetical protein SAY87_004910 [Trapa incisa]|uniref:Uncharacterized protein n=1 Tax=Trapa incisa TaxID=236973 RepID=A0AAN7PNT0_9MYRT|nr:hypothetical protein SAY87_004910 [Trapa incisa]